MLLHVWTVYRSAMLEALSAAKAPKQMRAETHQGRPLGPFVDWVSEQSPPPKPSKHSHEPKVQRPLLLQLFKSAREVWRLVLGHEPVQFQFSLTRLDLFKYDGACDDNGSWVTQSQDSKLSRRQTNMLEVSSTAASSCACEAQYPPSHVMLSGTLSPRHSPQHSRGAVGMYSPPCVTLQENARQQHLS